MKNTKILLSLALVALGSFQAITSQKPQLHWVTVTQDNKQIPIDYFLLDYYTPEQLNEEIIKLKDQKIKAQATQRKGALDVLNKKISLINDKLVRIAQQTPQKRDEFLSEWHIRLTNRKNQVNQRLMAVQAHLAEAQAKKPKNLKMVKIDMQMIKNMKRRLEIIDVLLLNKPKQMTPPAVPLREGEEELMSPPPVPARDEEIKVTSTAIPTPPPLPPAKNGKKVVAKPTVKKTEETTPTIKKPSAEELQLGAQKLKKSKAVEAPILEPSEKETWDKMAQENPDQLQAIIVKKTAEWAFGQDPKAKEQLTVDLDYLKALQIQAEQPTVDEEWI